MLRIIFFVIFLLQSSTIISYAYKVLDVDFIESMSDNDAVAKQILEYNIENLKIFQKQYKAKKPSKMPYVDRPLIPKVMHHIWFGEDIPPLYLHYLDECKKLYPDWEFKFWNEKDIDNLGIRYRDAYDKIKSYAGKSDIARYEILYRFGGVYKDLDVKCFRPIDDLNHKYTFFAAIEPVGKPIKAPWKFILNNGIIGSSPGNPILRDTLTIINNELDHNLQEFEKNISMNIHQLAIKSSMLPLTEGFLNQSSIHDKNIALPSTYFLSLLNFTFKPVRSLRKWRQKLSEISYDPMKPQFHFLRPESLMFHNYRIEDKREIPYCDFDYGNHMNTVKINLVLKGLEIHKRKMLKVFQRLYTQTIPAKGRLNLNRNSKTPQTIHFVIFNKSERVKLEKNLPTWEILNRNFAIKVWDEEKLKKSFSDINFNIDSLDLDCLRFYFGLRILEKFGGTYANYLAKPHQPIFELNNRFNFYAGLMPIVNRTDPVILSQKLIGAKKGHPIISNTLKKVNYKNLDSVKKIGEIFTLEAYHDIHLTGTNIILPAIYFEPKAPNYTENTLDYIKRLYSKESKAFSTYTQFTVVE
ncbi:hypothetical protein phytr_3990 [Candidatus Phycorickettsia trachydisci]|uniref:Uncharacterized protein n=1 Tax=Candidatus Phycorickettsia trachydisci TaxID=2115978 RepID=A0A2P1P7V0_9RICK|nr:glycosyltransferase [Candidatus Phycorickettsia trachydisci]AVP87350.1 hypothetical protein phytr_3990 [Candidatus Phycorickettsia trachydisci]